MFIDANIFLEIFLKNRNYLKCEEFIKNLINDDTPFYTSDFILYSCMLEIYKKLGSDLTLRNFLIFINSIGIVLIRPSLKAIYDSANLMKKYRLDFDDALVISCMIENSIKDLISYDKHFTKIKEINVIGP